MPETLIRETMPIARKRTFDHRRRRAHTCPCLFVQPQELMKGVHTIEWFKTEKLLPTIVLAFSKYAERTLTTPNTCGKITPQHTVSNRSTQTWMAQNARFRPPHRTSQQPAATYPVTGPFMPAERLGHGLYYWLPNFWTAG
jgi:hypothetical protein